MQMIDDAVIRQNAIDYGRQVAVDQPDERLRLSGSRKLGEIGDLGYEDRDLPLLSAQLHVSFEDRVGDLLGHVPTEGVPDAIALSEALDHGVERSRELRIGCAHDLHRMCAGRYLAERFDEDLIVCHPPAVSHGQAPYRSTPGGPDAGGGRYAPRR